MNTTNNQFLLAIFFAPLTPISLIISSVGMVYQYWIEKILFIRRYKQPAQLSTLMINFFSKMLPIYALMWSLSLYIFYYRLHSHYNPGLDTFMALNHAYKVMWFAIIFNCLPVHNWIQYFYFSFNQKEQKYDEAKWNFDTTYQIENPITKKQGRIEQYEEIIVLLKQEKGELSFQEKRYYQQNLKLLKDETLFDVIFSLKQQEIEQISQQNWRQRMEFEVVQGESQRIRRNPQRLQSDKVLMINPIQSFYKDIIRSAQYKFSSESPKIIFKSTVKNKNNDYHQKGRADDDEESIIARGQTLKKSFKKVSNNNFQDMHGRKDRFQFDMKKISIEDLDKKENQSNNLSMNDSNEIKK